MRRSRFLLFVVLAVVVIVVLVMFDRWKGETQETKEVVNSFEIIDEAYEIIKERGVYPVEGKLLIEGALRGMTDVIGDPYSTYLTKDEAAAHKESLASERVGIGAELTRSNGKFIIVAPVKSSPADKAGLRPYDEIVRIDGEALAEDTLQDVVRRIRGKEGTAVSMTIYRPELNKHLELSVVREKMAVTTVTGSVIEEKERKVGYISITTFGEETEKEWSVVTNDLLDKGAEALVIDVRGNPGGYLMSVGNVLGSILAEDTIYAFLQDVDGSLEPLTAGPSENVEYDEKLKKIPLVLLQDKGSASASEMLSGAIKDLKRGYIAGTESFGKGTVQETIHLTNGGNVKLSTAKWLTPNEKWIHGKGVETDIEVKQDGLFDEHIRLVTMEYKEGSFADDIAYGQRLLKGLGYSVDRDDGYFDDVTVSAVEKFRKDAKVEKGNEMDRVFFLTLKDQVEAFRKDRENDNQLQMALDYILHVVEEK